MSIAKETDHDQRAVDRVTGLSKRDFDKKFQFANRPVIFTDATAQWSANGKWTPEFFRDQLGLKMVEIDGRSYPLAEFISIVLAPQSDKPCPYLRNQPMHEAFPELLPDIDPVPVYCEPNWLKGKFVIGKVAEYMKLLSRIELFIGGPGSQFPDLHIDSVHTHAFLSQIYGQKELILFAPDQTPFLYSNHKGISMVNDLETPDLDKFPEFRRAVRRTVTINAGETLFVPAGWWHTARMLSPSITIAINTANASNWKDLVDDVTRYRSPVIKMLLSAYLTNYGRQHGASR